MKAIRGRLLALGAAVVFVSASKAMEAAGVEDALGYCLGAAVVAAMLTWALSS
jgi:hypothetical protein